MNSVMLVFLCVKLPSHLDLVCHKNVSTGANVCFQRMEYWKTIVKALISMTFCLSNWYSEIPNTGHPITRIDKSCLKYVFKVRFMEVRNYSYSYIAESMCYMLLYNLQIYSRVHTFVLFL